MKDIIVIIVILAIIGGAIGKIIIEKRRGAKCIGCPYGGSDNSNCNCK